ncbi:putative IS91-family integrase/recombinase [Octadecabacter antarcticus 307]|uniref:Putative IS91-family integrase/recombinase n=1 Tax=Octadecabacter antarcticus 307 TaxID=391626 RepID=M9R7W2_9RHOB|nr:tyrosine-type recombinase/integrase [Octadecabacter antarcticus]AGI65855.1 putative IS91-family integrase/recombinase [Octadecabacter antarcticus 307]
MNIQQLTPTTPLRARMIADMSGRNLGPASQTGHLRACKRFAAWLGRSPEMATPDDVKYFQQHFIESGVSICTRNQTMTGVKFLLRVTLRRHDLVAEIFHLKEPVKVALVLSKKEIMRILAMAPSQKAKVMLSLAYGCGMRAGEVVRLKVGDIDSAQEIIRIVQSKGRKDRNVMLPMDLLDLLREWWVERPTGQGKDVPTPERSSSRISRQLPLNPADLALVQRDRAGSWDHQAGHTAYVAAQFCDPPAGTRGGYLGDPSTTRPHQTDDHGTVCKRGHRYDRGGGQPVG